MSVWAQLAHHPAAEAVLALALVATVGLALGGIRLRGLNLGIAGVLFAGIVLGHFGLKADPQILDFVREFGLILFVYTIGIQVGPGFFASLRRTGLPLNLLSAGSVLGGAGLTVVLARLTGMDMAAAAGLFAGATTNTPALGAAQEALKSIPGMTAEQLASPALAYAACYPFGIVGIILVIILTRALFRVNVADETEAFRSEQRKGTEPLERINLEVTNSNFDGLRLADIPGIEHLAVTVTRHKPKESAEALPASPETRLATGDLLLAVGRRKDLEALRRILGREATEDLMEAPGLTHMRGVVVTNKAILGKPLRELGLAAMGVTVSRMSRADIEIPASPGLKLQFGDLLTLVGREDDLRQATALVGNSLKDLNHTNFIPVFLGIALGVVLGSIPFQPDLIPSPLKLGLAGGPLLAAILLARLGRVGKLVWYMPANANIALRELGITLFLAAVGLKAGGHFIDVLIHGDGVRWMLGGAIVTVLPLLVSAAIARLVLHLNFLNICGLLAGSTTDPPALAFACTLGQSDGPTVAYATVYPLTMLLRILSAQLLVLLFA
ncbi:MAG: putative transporter [Candidatus Methylacidiphilales bacterium]